SSEPRLPPAARSGASADAAVFRTARQPEGAEADTGTDKDRGMGLEAPPGRHLGAEAARAALPGAAVPGVAVPGVARAVLRHRAPGRLASRVAPLSGRRRGTPDRSPAAARALA